MTELIDKKLLIDTIGIAVECKDCKRKGTFGCNESSAFAYACESITDAPIFELIRCEDCQNFEFEEHKSTGLCRQHTEIMFTWDYCSMARKKEES